MKIAVIGGGFTGLTAAYELLKSGHEVSIFEKDNVLGGLAHGFRQPSWDWSLEKAYHHFFTNDDAILALIKKLGLCDKLIVKRPVTAVWWKNHLYPFDSPESLLAFPGLSFVDKLRTGALMAALKLNSYWKPLESITAEHLFRTIGGTSAYKTIWEPLLYGKFGDYAPRISAAWLWARINKRTSKLCYIEGGFHTLITALEQVIKQNGGTIHTGVTVNEIKKQNWKLETRLPDGQVGNWKFDKVLLTVPTPIAAKLFPDLAFGIGHLALSIPHLHAHVLILETKEPILKDVYWLNITDRSFPFLAVVAHTNFIDKKHYGGHHLTYFGNYLQEGHRYLSMSAEQLLEEFLPFIHRLSSTSNFKIQTSNSRKKSLQFKVLSLKLFTGMYAQPVHTLHYSHQAPTLVTPTPNLYLANMDSIYPWDRGTNYAVELGQKAAKKIHEDAKEPF